MSAEATAMAAARARIRGRADPRDAALLTDLDPAAWRVIDRRGRDQRALLLDTPPEYEPEADHDAVANLTSLRSQVLLAVLASTTQERGDHPWPGTSTTVGAVMELLGGARIPTGRRRHLVAALRDLAAHELVDMPGHHPEDTPDGDTEVRVGVAVAGWEGPWLDDLARLLDDVPGPSDGRPGPGGRP